MGNSPEALALAFANYLLAFAIVSTLLLGTAVLLARILNRFPSRTKDLALKLALIGALVIPVWHTFYNAGPIRMEIAFPLESATVTAPQNELLDVAASDSGTGELQTQTETQALTNGEAGGGFTSLLVALLLLWPAGAAVQLARYGLAWRRLLQGISDRGLLEDDRLYALLAEDLARLSVRRRIRLTTSDAISSPIALGRGEICIPRRLLDDLDSREARTVIAHEIAHLRRYDPIWMIVFGVAKAVFFFQPLVTAAMRSFSIESEHICDEEAVRLTGDPGSLARSILKSVSQGILKPAESVACGMAGDGAVATERTERILKVRNTKPEKLRHLIGALIVVAVFIMAGWSAPSAVIVNSQAAVRASLADATSPDTGTDSPGEKDAGIYKGQLTWVDGTVHEVEIEVLSSGVGTKTSVLPVTLKCSMKIDEMSQTLITVEIANKDTGARDEVLTDDTGPYVHEKKKTMEKMRRIVNDLLDLCTDEDHAWLAKIKAGLNKGEYKVTMGLAVSLTEFELSGWSGN